MRRAVRDTKRNRGKIIAAVSLTLLIIAAGLYYFFFYKSRLTAIEIDHPLPVPYGQSRQMKATAVYSDNSRKDITALVTWHSSDTRIAEISNTLGSKGSVKGSAPGQVVISATEPDTGTRGQTPLTILAPELISILITPENPGIILGQRLQLAATGIYANGQQTDITQTVNWFSSDTAIVDFNEGINPKGLALSTGTGKTTVSALDTASGTRADIIVTVSEAKLVSLAISPSPVQFPLGIPKQMTATGTYTDGSSGDVTHSVVWSTSDPKKAVFDKAADAAGRLFAKSVGEVTISVSDAATGLSASAKAVIQKPQLVSIQILPQNETIPLGKTLQFLVRSRYTDGSSHNLKKKVEWFSTDPNVADIGSGEGQTGLAVSKSVGSTTVKATDPASRLSNSTLLKVVPAQLDVIRISPENPSIPMGEEIQLAATGIYTDGKKQNITHLCNWSSSDSEVASVENLGDNRGLVRSQQQGVVNISVNEPRSGAKGLTTLTVNRAALSAITVIPQQGTLPLGTSQKFKAEGTYSDGSVKDITSLVDWRSSDPAVAAVKKDGPGKGTLSSTALGDVEITVREPVTGLAGSATASVTSASLLSIVLKPDKLSLPLGARQQITATGTYTDGSSSEITASLTWSSAGSDIASVDQGLVSSVAMGNTSIRVKDPQSGIRAAAPVTVTEPALKSISISPDNSKVYLGKLQQYTATGHYTNGDAVDMTTRVNWSSSDTTIASIRDTDEHKGLATPHAVGTAAIIATDPKTGVKGSTNLTGAVKWK